jgi:hypothetical protein
VKTTSKSKSAPIAANKDTEHTTAQQEETLDYIYCLFEIGSLTKFYIGRTDNPKRRLREHRYGAKNYKPGDEWKYEYASTLNAAGLKWGLEVLMTCGPDTEFYEDYFVNKYRNEPLQNMRAGDSEPWMGRDYADARSFIQERNRCLQIIKEPKIRVKKESDVSLTRFVDDVRKETISPALQAIYARRKPK